MSTPCRMTSSHVYVLIAVSAISCLLLQPASAAAQTGHESHWGVRVSFAPSWEISDGLREKLFDENEEGTIKGTELAIGFVRGSTLGGDWGVSFVRKPWKDGSGTTSTDVDCFNQAQSLCRPRTESTLTKGAYLDAVEVHRFIRLVNIKRRVQLGLNVGGGIGAMRGEVVTTDDGFEPTGFNQQGPTGFIQIHEESTRPAKDELLKYFPLGKVEGVASLIVAPGLKVQVAAGMNFPSYSSARVGLVYLIGAR
jgi:hypothetical protein